MSVISKCVTENPKKSNEFDEDIHLFKCKSCLWDITIYESIGRCSWILRKYIVLYAIKKDEF